LQVRTADTNATTATVTYQETAYGPVTTAAPDEIPAAATPRLHNFPNPFNPRTTIELTLPAGSGSVPVEVAVFDLRGRRVIQLFGGPLAAGLRHGFTWDGRDDSGRAVPSGVYFARAIVGERVQTAKMLLVR
jgi:hypothetical protein